MGLHHSISLFAVAVLWSCSPVVHGQDNGSQSSWMHGKWSRTDPFTKARRDAESKYRTARDKATWIHDARKTHYKDEQELFTFVLGSYLYSVENRNYDLAFAEVDSLSLREPQSYEATRARYLLMARNHSDDELCNLGERLLKWKEDLSVRYELARMRGLAIYHLPKNYVKAVVVAEDFARRYPNDRRIHSVLGADHYHAYSYLHMKEARNSALRELRMFIESNPPHDYYRKKVEKWIKELESSQ